MSMIKGKSFKMKLHSSHFQAHLHEHALKKYSFLVLIHPELILKPAASNETSSVAKVNNKNKCRHVLEGTCS